MPYGTIGSPFPTAMLFVSKGNDSLKNTHGAYDIYVNEEFIGKKCLLQKWNTLAISIIF